MNSRINKENINIDEIISIYLKDKDGNMVEIFEKYFNYDYMYNSSGNKKLNICCDLSDKNKVKSSSTITVSDPGLGFARVNEGWTIPNNAFNRDYIYASCNVGNVDVMPLSVSRDDKIAMTVVNSAELSQTWGEAVVTDCKSISAEEVK